MRTVCSTAYKQSHRISNIDLLIQDFGNIADPNEFLNKVDVRCAWIAMSSVVPF